MTTLPLTPDELLTTTRTVRKRLDLERPVPMSLIRECLEVALQAPSGSNRQGWQWVVVTDADRRRRIGKVEDGCAGRPGRADLVGCGPARQRRRPVRRDEGNPARAHVRPGAANWAGTANAVAPGFVPDTEFWDGRRTPDLIAERWLDPRSLTGSTALSMRLVALQLVA
jgi:nitroreductase